MKTATTLSLLCVAFATAVLGACTKEPPCKAGKPDAAWEAAPLSALIPKDATVCEGSSPTSLKLWKPVKVHDANMAAVDAAQSNGWDRVSDNWYPKAGEKPTDFNSPKWSELKNATGGLRIDVHEEAGGASVELKLTKK